MGQHVYGMGFCGQVTALPRQAEMWVMLLVTLREDRLDSFACCCVSMSVHREPCCRLPCSRSLTQPFRWEKAGPGLEPGVRGNNPLTHSQRKEGPV